MSIIMENAAKQTERERIADDLIVGATAIAAELGVNRHAVYYLAARRLLPIGRLGKSLIASRKKLQRALSASTD
jgi:hypothetical protein